MRFLLRRIGFYALALWGAITLNYLIPRMMPGSPVDGLMARLSPSQLAANPHMVDNLRAFLGVQKEPFLQGYVDYLKQVFTGDFGISTSNFPTPVSEVVGRTLPYSIALVGVGFVLAFFVGTSLGMLAAWRRGGLVDNVATPALISLGAFPAFFTALLAVYFFGLKLGWFPIQHAYDIGTTPGWNWEFISSTVRHGALPALIIMFVFAGGWLLNMRNVMINTVEEDFVGMAHAKGLRERRVMTMYAGRNAILPPLTGFASQFGAAVGGLVFIEFVFSYPGVGLTLQQAALGSDYPLTQAILLVFSVTVLVANLFMDVMYVILDPRVRTT
jgi:peptide/nickel transport system permease protein